MRLTLRTLLAYLDDTLTPSEARELGLKLAETQPAQDLADRIRRVTRRRGLATPSVTGEGTPSDPNTVAEYLSDTLSPEQTTAYEKTCLDSDVHLAEVAACHQILTLVLSEQVRVPPTARRRMYQLVKGRESIPDRRPGKTIPIGGVLESKQNTRFDDSDAGLLLGMPAFVEGEPSSRRLLRYASLGGLLVAFAFALWMAVPPTPPVAPATPVAVATVPRVENTTPRPVPPVIAPAGTPEVLTIAPRPAGQPFPTADAQAVEQGTVPEAAKKDLTAGVEPPRQDRVAVGRLALATGVAPIVVRRPPAGDAAWARVMPTEPTVASTDLLSALPGYKAPIRLDSGVTLDLWGNIPDLVPAPVLDSSVTLWLPAEGYDADVTLHRGRVYVGATKPTGAKIRIRFLTDAWDVTLGDEKSEIIFEVFHEVGPGVLPEPRRTTAGLAVTAGRAIVKFRYGQPRTLNRGDDIAWDSKAGKPDVRVDPQLDPAARAARSSYLAKVPVYPDAARATPILQALDDFSKAMRDPDRVRAVFIEALQDRPPSDQTRATARVALFELSALRDLNTLADALNDPNRPLVRQTAAEALRIVFAADPETSGLFRQVLVEKSRLSEQVADTILWLIRGFSERERGSPETIDTLIAGLENGAVAVRELSFLNLIGYIDPQEKSSNELIRFDAGAPSEFRTPVVAAWKKRSADLKKKLDETPPPRPAKG